MRLCLRCAVLSVFALGAVALHAQNVVIYRCTDASGALTFQNNVPCPKGSKQVRRVVPPAQTVATPPPAAPPHKAAPSVIAPATTTVVPTAPSPQSDILLPASTIADSDRLPPPPLFQCNTYDNDSYLSENAEPAPRCIRVPTTGIDGNAETGAGEACQMVTDQCQRVPDAAACNAWKKRAKEIEATWRFAHAADKETNQVEYRRVAQILRDSTCKM